VGGVWLLVLGGWMVWTLYGQLKEIRKFADTEARPVVPAQPAGEALTELRAMINKFGEAVGRGEKAVLRLTVDELNALLAAEEEARPMRENAKVESIGDSVKLRVSLALNGVPFSGERLYINGFAEISPVVDKDNGIKLRISTLTVPRKTVPDSFLSHYKEHGHLDTLLMDPVRTSRNPALMEVIKKLTAVRLEPGAAVLEFVPSK